MSISPPAFRFIVAFVGSSLTPLIAPSALAQAQSASTAVVDPSSNANLRHLCPGIDSALEEALGAVWHQVGLQSTLQVQMRIDGREVSVMRISGGPIEYRRAVDRAAARLTCDAGAGGSRVLSFDVRFVGPDGAAGAPARLARR